MDLSIFANPNFDPNDYANAILAGEPYVPHQHGDKTVPATGASAGGTSKADVAAKEDVSVAISKLSFGIDDVSKQIKSLVSAHHEDLLAQAASASALSGSLTSVRAGLNDLDASLEKIRAKVRTPYQSLQTHVARLQKAQEASDVLRRMSRFVVLARRLQVQMRTMGDVESVGEANDGGDAAITLNTGGEQDDNKERTIAKAALTISELSILIDGPDPASTSQEDTGKLPDGPAKGRSPAISLRDINAVAAHIPFIEDARAKVNSEMESMVLSGLTTLDQSLLAASLQTAYNLRVLPELVQGLVQDLAQAVEQRIHSAFDLNKISRDAAKDTGPTTSPQSHSQIYKSRVRTEPTNITVPQWTAALWTRLEGLIEEMAACCIKVYALEKVLKMKKDSSTQTVFLDEAMKLLENKPSSTFWISLGRSLEKSTKESAKSPWLSQWSPAFR
jgi:HPt (histidine-containing phosphotransfer) domain-containing protein